MAGYNMPMTKLFQNNTADYLLEFEDKTSRYWQILSFSCFPGKHWGYDFNVQSVEMSEDTKRRSEKFESALLSEYGDKHYVKPSFPYSATYNHYQASSYTNNYRVFAGLIYRVESEKFYVYPKFSIGMSPFSRYWGRADLKEKNSHNEYELYYSPGEFLYENDDDITQYNFTVAPSVSFGYKLTKKIYLNMDVLASYYRPDFVFEKRFTNLVTKETTTELIAYKKNMFNISLGIGLIWVVL